MRLLFPAMHAHGSICVPLETTVMPCPVGSNASPAGEQNKFARVLHNNMRAMLRHSLHAQIYAPTAVQSRVAYQGVPGAYSESAAQKACPQAEPLPCDQFEVAFQALAQWLADTAVLPIENSLGGSIHTVFDLLIRSLPQLYPHDNLTCAQTPYVP